MDMHANQNKGIQLSKRYLAKKTSSQENIVLRVYNKISKNHVKL